MSVSVCVRARVSVRVCVLNANPPSRDRSHIIYVFDVSGTDLRGVGEMSLPQFWRLSPRRPPGGTIWRVTGGVSFSLCDELHVNVQGLG